jgi:hypothetical protein
VTAPACSFGPDGGQSCGTTGYGQMVIVALTNRADATCGYVQSQAASSTDTILANLDVLQLAVGTANGDVAPGTYDVEAMDLLGSAPTPAAAAQFETGPPVCKP